MPLEGVALIPTCRECKAAWQPTDHQRWRAYLGCDEGAEREFGDD